MALLTPSFHPEADGDPDRLVRDLATGLRARDHRPHVVTSHPGRPSSGTQDGLPVTRHWRPPDGRLDRRRLEGHLTHVPFSYLSLRTGSYDIAQALHVGDAQAAARWSRRTGRPSIYSPPGVLSRAWLMAVRKRLQLNQRATHGCTAVTATSRFAADELWRWLGVEARVINPGVDLSGLHPTAQRAERPTVFCATDSEDSRRGGPLLHEAFEGVRRERPDARLVFSPHAVGEAWVSALPSGWDAPVQALACGTPVVAFDLPETREIVDSPDVGRLFRGADPQQLARMLLEAFELASDPMTAAACRRRAEAFSVDRCVERHLDLYRELLDRPAQPMVISSSRASIAST